MLGIVEHLEPRTFLSVTGVDARLSIAEPAIGAHVERRRPKVPPVSLVGEFSGEYSNATLGQSGIVSGTVHGQTGRRISFVLRFDGLTLVGLGTVRGQIVRLKASTAAAVGPRARIVARGLTTASGEIIEGSYQLKIARARPARTLGSFRLVREPPEFVASPIGPEVRVNTHMAGDQASPAISTNESGAAVVVWRSDLQDGSGWGIFAQRYGSDGLAVGGEIQVNSTTTGDQLAPEVAIAPDGRFVVVWSGVSEQAGPDLAILMRAFNADGTAATGETRVSTSAGPFFEPVVAMDANGALTISWFGGAAGSNVFARQFSPMFVPVGDNFQVNTFTSDGPKYLDLAVSADGSFVVTWNIDSQDGSDWGVFARAFDSRGLAAAAEFQVNSFTAGRQAAPSIAMDPMGRFAITWQSEGQDGSSWAVYGRRYDHGAVPQGAEFQINEYTSIDQSQVSSAMDSAGNLFVVWHSGPGQDGNDFGVYGRYYDAAGAALGHEFRINTYTTGFQGWPSAALAGNGRAIVAWHSVGQDTDSGGVYSQRFLIELR